MTALPTLETAPQAPADTAPRAGRRPRARTLLLVPALLFLALLVVAAAAPGLFTGAAPNATHPLQALRPPGAGHWFGTDQLGRDLYTRVVYGTRLSLLLGAGSTALSVLAGAALGLTAGLGGRVADQVLMRLADVLLALPPILLALLAVAVLGSGTVNVALAIAAAFAPGYARIVRAETLVVRRSGYVEAATTLGLSRAALIRRHVVPNALGPLLVLATVGFGSSLIAASGLSFLGLGPQPPTAEWGAMLDQGRDFLQTAWWLGIFPGAAITLTALVVNIVGRQAQARFTRRTGR
ncbi:peptide/nickel transport system permease protein [Actinacidiphila yanglinensis]|uniref:Peptide/nickel transport system permease protein n=1 Tax=Actinacidiphila yanglinensis TaxID=310779 RepID=A0A1H6DQ77_9ACTN|nr:ABC transporter permease [Actinacidiphila yanglinensis]SEG87502.1 peptide/nickel transport system permease protein [Actinacidiphila yanglinensis]